MKMKYFERIFFNKNDDNIQYMATKVYQQNVYVFSTAVRYGEKYFWRIFSVFGEKYLHFFFVSGDLGVTDRRGRSNRMAGSSQ